MPWTSSKPIADTAPPLVVIHPSDLVLAFIGWCIHPKIKVPNVFKGLTLLRSKTANVYAGPHGYAAFRTGSSRVIVD